MTREVKKFPVKSSVTGKEYLVTVTYREYNYLPPDWAFKLYKPKGRNIFGKLKFEAIMTRSYDAHGKDAFHGDFVKAAKDLVTEYESKVMELKQQNDLYSKCIADFEKWDGVV